MKRKSLIGIGLMLLTMPAFADRERCSETAPHRLTADVNGATSITVIGRAGSLEVTGARVAAVTATGTACASEADFLAGMRIEARREGSELVIEAIIPERTMVFGWHQASLDFEVTVPDHLPVRVTDGSGSARVRDVASLSVKDGSGELDIRRVRGSVEVSDGSGSITIIDVGGDVRLRDGSGGMEIEKVGGNVIVERDGSGGIDVADVRGSFTVEQDGSGGIDYRDVSGTVSVPSKR